MEIERRTWDLGSQQEQNQAIQRNIFKLRKFSQIWSEFIIPWIPLVELQFKWKQSFLFANQAVNVPMSPNQ